VSDVEVLYQDAKRVAVAKPPGLLVHRTSEAPDRDVLLQRVRDRVGCFVYPVHRVDRNASGVVLFALSPEECSVLQAALAQPDARKEYLVLVRGSTPMTFESRRPIGGKESWTEFERLAEIHRSSLLRARIHSGRRHQIRKHLNHLAHQILGDRKYGKGRINRSLKEKFGLNRMFLHARRLELSLSTGERLRIEAPLAPDLAEFLQRLPEWTPELARFF
jgi:tRNA pseudouridine65 synthase